MATVYLSPTGSDSYTYAQAQSISTPWQTIGKCNTSATTGDTIICLNGTHTWASVTFTKSFTIQAQTNGSVIFDAGSTGVVWADIYTLSVTGLSFKNNTGYIGGSQASIFYKKNLETGAMTFNTCSFENIQLKNDANIGGLFSSGVGFNSAAWTLNVTNCLINVTKSTTNSTSASSLIGSRQASGSVYTLTGNTICLLGTSGAGTQLDNLFWNTSTFTNCSVVMKNNIVYCPSTAVTWNTGTAFNSTSATYNDFYQVTSSPAGTGNITSDPLLVDAANGNYNLRPTSPCIGSGSV